METFTLGSTSFPFTHMKENPFVPKSKSIQGFHVPPIHSYVISDVRFRNGRVGGNSIPSSLRWFMASRVTFGGPIEIYLFPLSLQSRANVRDLAEASLKWLFESILKTVQPEFVFSK